MQHVRCEQCGGQFAMNDTVKLKGVCLCVGCAEKRVQQLGGVPQAAVEVEADPTVCVNCGHDNGTVPLERLAGLPACDNCVHFFRHRPFPNWVKLAALGLLVLVVFALYFNGRFFLAYWEIGAAFRTAAEGDVAQAADLMESASEHVPESPDLQGLASYFRGIQLLAAEQSAEALAHLEKVRGRLPPELRVDDLVLQARMGKCFDERDYDGFLEHATEMAKRHPDEPTAVAQVASAYACKYAVTEDAQFKEKALEALGRAKAIAQGDPDFAEYEDRILHRIESREVISRKQFQERFPHGWHGKEDPER